MKRTTWSVLLNVAVPFAVATLSYAQVPPPPGPMGPRFVVEYGTDLPGADIRPGFPVSDIGQCMDSCAYAPDCRSFTFVKPYQQPPQRNNPSPLCWLKGAVPGRVDNPGMLSGIKN